MITSEPAGVLKNKNTITKHRDLVYIFINCT